jgi:tetratricopeptide (TPR) repeat protein
MAELPESLYQEILVLSHEADRALDPGGFDTALGLYNDALQLVPEPLNDWNATTWLLASIGNAAFFAGYFDVAIEALTDAVLAPNGLGNPFIHLRLGQSSFELGDFRRAADELLRAYMALGDKCFEREDPKYREFLGMQIILD